MVSECISSCDPFTGESILVINERFETLKYDLRFLHHLVSNLLFPIGRKKVILHMFEHQISVIISIIVNKRIDNTFTESIKYSSYESILYDVTTFFNNYYN